MREFMRGTPEYSGNTQRDNDFLPEEWGELQQENQEIVAEYVAELRKIEPVVEALVGQLAAGAAEARWNAIIGDDIRGRAVALLAGSVLKRYAEALEQPAPRRLFIATGKHDMEDRWQAIEAYTSHIRGQLGTRVLFITEYIESGGTAQRAIALFQHLGITCDVAATYLYGDGDKAEQRISQLAEDMHRHIPEWQGRLHIGQICSNAPSIDEYLFKLYDVMGVQKSFGPTTVATAILKGTEAQADDASDETMAQIKTLHRIHQATVIAPVREEIARMSDRIYASALSSMI